MKLVTPKQMHDIDTFCAEVCGLPTRVLMERAAGALRDEVCARFDLSKTKIAAFCGGGNNGGDGLAALVQLREAGAAVSACIVSESGKINEAVGHYRSVLEAAGVPVLFYTAEGDFCGLQRMAAEADVILDCLLGTGFHGTIGPFLMEVIEEINRSNAFVISADIPSGCAVQADVTVSFGRAKPDNVLYPGRAKCGVLRVVDIGIPEKAIARFAPKETEAEYFSREESELLLARCFPAREADSHKGSFGKAGILAGSFGMCGAAVLTAEACLRTGAGLVTLLIPHGLTAICETLFREAVKCPVGRAGDEYFTEKHLYEILHGIKSMDTLVIGPGLGSHPETYAFVRILLEELSGCYEGKVVLDADGLNAFTGKLDLLRIILNRNGFGQRVILTPHPAELSRLTGVPVLDICVNRLSVACKTAESLHTTVLLKGASTVTACPDGRYTVNGTGNSGMATGGSGDVLSGIIGGLALRENIYDSGRLGAFYHGFLGDMAASHIGEAAMLAGDLIAEMKKQGDYIHVRTGYEQSVDGNQS